MNRNSPIAVTESFVYAQLEQRDLSAALSCLSHDIVWFGTGDFEVAQGKEEAETFLAAEIKDHPQGFSYAFQNLTEHMLTENSGTVFGKITISDNLLGSQMHCRLTAACVKKGEDYYIASLHLSMASHLQKGREFFPVTLTEQKVREMKEDFFNTSMPGGVVCCDAAPGFQVRYANEYLFQMLGFENQEDFFACTKGFFSACLSPDEDKEGLDEAVLALPLNTDGTFTYRITTKAGEERWIRDRSHKFRDENGEYRVFCFCTDVSDIVFMEQEIFEKKSQLEFANAEVQTIINNIPGGVHRCRLFSDLRLDYISSGMEKMCGYTLGEIETMFQNDFSLLLVEEDRKAFVEAMLALSKVPGECTMEYRMRKKDGNVIWVTDCFRSIRLEDGKMWGFGVSTDTTREREVFAQLKLLTDSLPVVLSVYDYTPEKIRLSYCSQNIFETLGYTVEEYQKIVEDYYGILAHPEDFPLLEKQVQRLVQEDVAINCDYRIKSKSGEYRWLNARGVIGERCGDTLRLNVVKTDITESRIADEKLRIRDEEYRIAMQQSGKLVYRYDVREKTINMPKEMADAFDLPMIVKDIPEGILSINLVAPESINTYIAFYRSIDNGENSGSAMISHKRKDGSFRWHSMRFTTIFSSTGQPVSAVISTEDITEEHEKNILSVLDKQRLLVALKSIYPLSLSVNLTTNHCRILSGREYLLAQEIEGEDCEGLLESAALFVHPDDRDVFLQKFRNEAIIATFAAGKESERMEYRSQYADGQYHWLEMVVFHIKNPYDDDILDIALIRNIDEQKAMEEKLRESLAITSGELAKERYYQELLDNTIPVGTVMFRLDASRILHIGGVLLDSLGYSQEEFEKLHHNKLKGLIYEPDYEETMRRVCRWCTEKVPNYEQEFRAVKKNGEIIWLLEKGTLTKDVDGNPAYISIYVDISQRRKMEEEVRVLEEETRLAMTQMGKMVCRYDVESHTLTMPKVYAEKHGVPEKLTNVPWSVEKMGLLDEKTSGSFVDFYDQILQGQASGSMETHIKLANGSWSWEGGEFVNIFDDEGKPIKAIIYVEDITEQRIQKVENEILRQNEELFKIVVSHSDRYIVRYDIATRTAYAQGNVAKAFGVNEALTNVPYSFVARGLIADESVKVYIDFYERLIHGNPEARAIVRMKNFLLDAWGWYQFDGNVIFDDKMQPLYAVVSFEEITDRYEKDLAFERMNLRRRLIPNDAMLYYEVDLTKKEINRGEGRLYHYMPKSLKNNGEKLVQYGINRFVVDEDKEKLAAYLKRKRLLSAFAAGDAMDTLDFRIMINGVTQWIRLSSDMISDPYSGNVRIYLIFVDIDKEKRRELGVLQRAETDGMTKLLNKTTIEQKIREIMAKEKDEISALAIVDIDNLKIINDTLGHVQGDNAIKYFAETLRNHFRKNDIIGRAGGDEFLVFLRDVENEAKLKGAMYTLVRKLASLHVGEKKEYSLHGSIGIVLRKSPEESFDALYKKADMALYHVKQNGKNNYAFYTSEMEKEDYLFQKNEVISLKNTALLNNVGLHRFLSAASAYFPLVISVNLTKNTYDLMQYENYATQLVSEVGTFDDLVKIGEKSFHPQDRASFLATFARENLLAAYQRGKRRVWHEGWQLSDNGTYFRVRTDVIFVSDEESGDICEVTMAVPIDEQQPEKYN